MRLSTFLLTGSCLLFVQSVGEAADQVSFLEQDHLEHWRIALGKAKLGNLGTKSTTKG